ncbi:4,5-dihydroxyphthalate decarboxylase [Gordonia sp. ABSL11-1]|uniref:ABC transporter substrate-binding protein n=1 Tax=Gordonia sp. ABSL11-1 TaxID=3053924 RepID=UPI0025723796|nr:4,5-dihydroxyphthalate decarboxylase [Gordonia sp. ABSL11-1]MDL9946768.1 4,5-dihydroxyphthalate decarboxylase [Gordonia sp. ABSL11-1]
MNELPLRIGGYRYEHTRALFDGKIPIDGVQPTFVSSALISDVFEQMAGGELDVAEYGFTYFLRSWDTPESPLVALPIFPNRNFRHEALFVSERSGIGRPEDLAGKTIGEFALWGHDPGVWMKGILADEYGVTPEQCRWVIGGTDFPIPSFDWIPQPVPDGVDVRHAPEDATLADMLESGEIDALLSVDVPKALLNGSTTIRRLFPDYPSVERDYYHRTGVHPMMHVVAIRREIVAEHPEVARALYDAYCTDKDRLQDYYRDQASKQHMGVITPWFSALFEENRRVLGEDWWPYGVERNRKAVDTFLRYHHEQGLSRTLLTSDDIFTPTLLDT